VLVQNPEVRASIYVSFHPLSHVPNVSLLSIAMCAPCCPHSYISCKYIQTTTWWKPWWTNGWGTGLLSQGLLVWFPSGVTNSRVMQQKCVGFAGWLIGHLLRSTHCMTLATIVWTLHATWTPFKSPWVQSSSLFLRAVQILQMIRRGASVLS